MIVAAILSIIVVTTTTVALGLRAPTGSDRVGVR